MHLLDSPTYYVRTMSINLGLFNKKKMIIPLFIIQAPKGISAFNQLGPLRIK